MAQYFSQRIARFKFFFVCDKWLPLKRKNIAFIFLFKAVFSRFYTRPILRLWRKINNLSLRFRTSIFVVQSYSAINKSKNEHSSTTISTLFDLFHFCQSFKFIQFGGKKRETKEKGQNTGECYVVTRKRMNSMALGHSCRILCTNSIFSWRSLCCTEAIYCMFISLYICPCFFFNPTAKQRGTFLFQ